MPRVLFLVTWNGIMCIESVTKRFHLVIAAPNVKFPTVPDVNWIINLY